MKKYAIILAVLMLVGSARAWSQVINSLPSEYDKNINDVCIRAQNNWAMDYNITEKNLADIYQALNFSQYRIEVVVCNELYASAMAYLDRSSGSRYILINENKAADLNLHYYSHLFIIAHEFSHHILNHFTSNRPPTMANKRAMELEADENGASLVKSLGGSADDCKFALDQLNHPEDDTNTDHPTKAKRYAAVDRGFGINRDAPITYHTSYRNYFKDLANVALLQYSTGFNKYDISYFSSKTKMFPKSILYYKNSYWIYWQKDDNIDTYSIYWNYSYYPQEEIQKYFDQGYRIEFLEKIGGGWYIVLLKYRTVFAQYVRTISKTDFYFKTGAYQDNVQYFLDNRYSIQNIIESGSNFVILYTQLSGSGPCVYAYNTSYTDFETWYRQQKEYGYNYMYCYKYVDNRYFGFMTKKSGLQSWTTSTFDGLDATDPVSKLNQGYTIDNITVDNNFIHLIFCKYY